MKIATAELCELLGVIDLSDIRPISNIQTYSREVIGGKYLGAKEIFTLQYQGDRPISGVIITIANTHTEDIVIEVETISYVMGLQPTQVKRLIHTISTSSLNQFKTIFEELNLSSIILSGNILDNELNRILEYR